MTVEYEQIKKCHQTSHTWMISNDFSRNFLKYGILYGIRTLNDND